ncbi:MAG: ATP-binding protein, partial [Bacteroidota bacterium]
PDNPYTTSYDLTNCDREPIHIIQSVQGFAAILVVDISSWVVRQVSTNIHEFLRKDATQVLEKPLSHFFPNYVLESLQKGVAASDFKTINPIALPVKENLPNHILVAHQQDQQLVLEIEVANPRANNFNFLDRIDSAIQHIQSAQVAEDLFQIVAREVKSVTGYDRVMVYRFDENYNGAVIAEAKEDHLSPFLGLNYPASDIPKQARQLYFTNRIRIIGDVNGEVALMEPPLHPATSRPLDMSRCAARGSSPVHLEYLRNMGVHASLSVAIIEDEKLWGLIACHHYADKKRLHYRTRNLVRFMGQIISGHLSLYRASQYRTHLLQKGKMHARLLEQMNQEQDVAQGILNQSITLTNYIESVGAALIFENKIQTIGQVPSEEHIKAIENYLVENVDDLLFSTSRLNAYPIANNDFTKEYAGLLAIKISENPSEFILWFRLAKTKVVRWGGDPNRAKVKTDDKARISPRKSFEEWKQVVAHQSEPWLKYEIDAALNLRNDIKEIILKRFNELKRLHKELKTSYGELESFSYSVSHDLRSPLRAIEGFSQILLEDYSPQLDDYGVNVVNTIVDSIHKLNEFINDILALSKLAKLKMIYNNVQLNQIIPKIYGELTQANEQYRKANITYGQLPTVSADQTMMIQLFQNLISNALKYSSTKEHPEIHIAGEVTDGKVIYQIKDNGIGMEETYIAKIFDVFSRLVSAEEFEGSGIGLSIVKRIVERHSGTIAVESKLGEGSTFWIMMPLVDEQRYLD